MVPTPFDNVLIFTAIDAATGREVWRTDGSETGTVLVKDVAATNGSALSSSSADELVDLNGRLFFGANDGITGVELWTSDGTTGGTTMVKDINPGSGSSTPLELTVFGGGLYFNAFDPVGGRELWVSDGTEAGTVRVRDVRPGVSSSDPRELTVSGTTLFFRAPDGVTGSELWRTDGTEAGTARVKDIRPGALSSSPTLLTDVSGTLMFAAFETTRYTLWRSDGTESGTQRIKDVSPCLNLVCVPTAFAERWYISVQDGATGVELWSSDGTEAGTNPVLDIVPGPNSSSPSELTPGEGRLFFAATSQEAGRELWSTDGSAEGTSMVRDIAQGPLSSAPEELVVTGRQLFFSVAGVPALWLSDGTEAGTYELASFPGSHPFLFPDVAAGACYFTADAGAAGLELWKSDGTHRGTTMVQDVFTGAASSWPLNFVQSGHRVFFSAVDETGGRELWELPAFAGRLPEPGAQALSRAFRGLRRWPGLGRPGHPLGRAEGLSAKPVPSHERLAGLLAVQAEVEDPEQP